MFKIKEEIEEYKPYIYILNNIQYFSIISRLVRINMGKEDPENEFSL